MGHLTVTIVDAPCGAGKTTYAIQMMNKSIHQEGDTRKFIFITPFLKEVTRVKTECPGFHEPCDGGRSWTKSGHFKKLIQDGKNIVSTHALFKLIDKEALELIQMDNYTLILDEVMDVLEKEPISKADLRLLLDQGFIVIDDEDATVKASDKSEGYSGKFSELINNARMNRLIYLGENLLLWQFPPDIFQAFETSYILTYLFDGQVQKAYFDLHGVGYEYKTVNKTPDGYGLTDLKVDYDREFRNILRANVNIYEGHLNKIGEASNALSSSWFKDTSNTRHIAKVKAAQYNFFRNIVDGKSGEIIWTCFNANKEDLKGAGYSRSFIPHNTRATNEYRDRKSLSYMINKYPLTPVTMYFKRKDIEFDQGKYAVSEFIQWLLRSQIRDGKPVNLFLPSSRMRTLFREWMNG